VTLTVYEAVYMLAVDCNNIVHIVSNTITEYMHSHVLENDRNLALYFI
jgi:hypothetical protein